MCQRLLFSELILDIDRKILRPRLYGEKLSRVEGSPALPSQLLTTVYMSKVVPVDRVKVDPTKLFIDPT